MNAMTKRTIARFGFALLALFSIGFGESRAAVERLPLAAAPGKVAFAVRFTPRKAGRIAPRYVSPSTQSIRILTDGAHPFVVELSPSAPNCTQVAGSDSYVCKASFGVPAGSHIFTVTAYDRPGATGNVLSTNSTAPVTVKPAGTTTVGLALEGLVRYFGISLRSTPVPGTPAVIAVVAYAWDADENQIVGPAPYDNPITLTTSNPQNGVLSKTLLRSPADVSGLTLRYGGAAGAFRLSATANGLPPANVVSIVAGWPGTISEYPLPANLGASGAIGAGPAGALWFLEYDLATFAIAQISATGRVSTYGLGPTFSTYSPVNAITAGPSRAACRGPVWSAACYEWVALQGASAADFQWYIGRLASDGSFTVYPIPGAGLFAIVTDITMGPDDAVWFTYNADNGGYVGRVSPAGKMTIFPLPAYTEVSGESSASATITTGPDGALWFSVDDVGAGGGGYGPGLGRLTTAGRFTEFRFPLVYGFGPPSSIISGPDGALWFTVGGIGRMTTDGGDLTLFPLPGGVYGEPTYIATGSDGALWFSFYNQPELGRITKSGITVYLLPNGIEAAGLATGSDGALWFTRADRTAIGRLTLPQAGW